MAGKKVQNPIYAIDDSDYIALPYDRPNVFSKEEFNRIIEISKEIEKIDGSVGSGDKSGMNSDIRKSKIKWIGLTEQSRWIFNKLEQAVNEANRYYKFDLIGIDLLQVTEYTQGGYYDWHLDIGDGIASKRKLSFTAQLSNPDDYEGGELEFLLKGIEKGQDAQKQRGAAVIFPSYLPHRVTPVVCGTRWSLVGWVYGPPFH